MLCLFLLILLNNTFNWFVFKIKARVSQNAQRVCQDTSSISNDTRKTTLQNGKQHFIIISHNIERK